MIGFGHEDKNPFTTPFRFSLFRFKFYPPASEYEAGLQPRKKGISLVASKPFAFAFSPMLPCSTSQPERERVNIFSRPLTHAD